MDNAKIAAELQSIMEGLEQFMQPDKKPGAKPPITLLEWSEQCSRYSYQLGRLAAVKSLLEVKCEICHGTGLETRTDDNDGSTFQIKCSLCNPDGDNG